MSTDVPAPLTFVESTDTPTSLNMLIYGQPGSGKTVAACSAPGPVLVVNAEGPSALAYARHLYGDKIREVRFEGSATLRAVCEYLKRGSDGEQTVVIDSVGEVYATLLKEIGGSQPQIQHYGKVNGQLIDLIRFLRNLDVHVVLVAHEQIDDSEEGGAVRRPATGTKKNPEEVMKHMDVVAYCGVVLEDDKPPRYVGQLVPARGRRCKDRSGALGTNRDLDLTEWVEAFYTALAPPAVELPWEDGPVELPEADPSQPELAA